jgi:uncharacterized protein YqjF (DUF2071 family)
LFVDCCFAVQRKDLMDALTKRGCNVELIDWSPVAIKVNESAVPIGATPEYLAGTYCCSVVIITMSRSRKLKNLPASKHQCYSQYCCELDI